MPTFILYGPSGVGKTHVGNIISTQLGYFHYDADDLLSDEARQQLEQGQLLTKPMSDDFYQRLTEKIIALSETHPKLIVSQALIRKANRRIISEAIKDCHFIEIYTEKALALERVKSRNDWVSVTLAEKVFDAYQPMNSEQHLSIYNYENASPEYLTQCFIQLCKSLDRSPSSFETPFAFFQPSAKTYHQSCPVDKQNDWLRQPI